MRIWLLVALVIGLIGSMGAEADQLPCPTHHAAMAAEVSVASAAGVFVEAAASRDHGARGGTAAPDAHVIDDERSSTGHAPAAGHPCCDFAAAVVAVQGPALGPAWGDSGRVIPLTWLPPWPSLTFGIYRPPSFS